MRYDNYKENIEELILSKIREIEEKENIKVLHTIGAVELGDLPHLTAIMM